MLLMSSITSLAQNKSTETKGEIIYHVFQRSFYDGNGDPRSCGR